MAKAKVSLTLDEDIVEVLKKIEDHEDVKVSPMVNRVLRRFFVRPGKKFQNYRIAPKRADEVVPVA